MNSAVADAELLYPLSRFRERGGQSLPAPEVIDGASMPEPYHGLLVHSGDMTSRLERFYGSPMKLRVLHREVSAETYCREVLLCAQDTGRPVEYGAIEINLAAFAPEVREVIVEGRQPLGGILNHHQVPYRSEPRGFLRLSADALMSTYFELAGPHTLYGRSNALLDPGDGTVLARIVEVLPPHVP